MSYTLVRLPKDDGLSESALSALHAMWGACSVDRRGGHLSAAAWCAIGSDVDRAEILAWHLAYRDDDPAGMVAAVAVDTVELPP